MSTDIRWKQRYSNYTRALAQLNSAVTLAQQRELSDLEKQGTIHAFEFTYELSWNMLKDYLVWQGVAELTGSRDTIREAFSTGLIQEGDTWMAMLSDRNRTSHTYNEKTALEIITNIQQRYIQPLIALSATFDKLSEKAL